MRPAHSILAALAALSPLTLPARADLITVVLDHELIVTNNDIVIACFEPELTTQPFPSGSLLTNSLRFSFRSLPSGTVSALIAGNDLPQFPSSPFQTPALVADLGLNQRGTQINASRVWDTPTYDASTGDLMPASLGQRGDDGDFDIRAIPDGGSGYVGYATSDLTRFGYMQIQRLSLTQWRLVGYRYDDAGAPVIVENLIPAPTTLVALGLAALTPRRHRSTHRIGRRATP